MGTFLGHALPGTFFLVFAIWWTIKITQRYVTCKMRGTLFCNTVTYSCQSPCCTEFCRTFPIEAVVKIVATTIGMIGELVAGSQGIQVNGMFFITDLQHVTMYMFFCISGIVDLLVYFRCRCAPPGTDYVAAAFAFLGQALLFKFHLHGRTDLDVMIHTVLLYVVIACFIATLAEFYMKNSPLAGYTRTYFVFLQGTWFFHVGFILYPPISTMKMWNEQDHINIMLASIFFSWHFAAVAVVMVIIASITNLVTSRICLPEMYTSSIGFELITTKMNGTDEEDNTQPNVSSSESEI